MCALLNVAFFAIFHAFFVFFSEAVRTWSLFVQRVDGTRQAKFQRCLRYRVTGLRPNLPFSLLSFSYFLLPLHVDVAFLVATLASVTTSTKHADALTKALVHCPSLLAAMNARRHVFATPDSSSGVRTTLPPQMLFQLSRWPLDFS